MEICCGGYEDAITAWKGGAARIELNSALFLGGITPCTGTLKLIKEELKGLNVISMLRPRGGGFAYSETEYKSMLRDAQELLDAGTDGIAFGFLNSDSTIDIERTREMIKLIHSYHRTAVFHRAFDCAGATDRAVEQLIALKADRILTSGGKAAAPEGADRINQIINKYGNSIEILVGSGVNAENAAKIIKRTGTHQVHSSCRTWVKDPTSYTKTVSFSYAGESHFGMYETVSEKKVRDLCRAVKTAI